MRLQLQFHKKPQKPSSNYFQLKTYKLQNYKFQKIAKLLLAHTSQMLFARKHTTHLIAPLLSDKPMLRL